MNDPKTPGKLDERFRAFVRANEWKNATSVHYINAPHSYVIKGNCPDQAEFNWAVGYIRKNGMREQFWGRSYIYFYIDGLKYWTMGAPISTTKIINRARI